LSKLYDPAAVVVAAVLYPGVTSNFNLSCLKLIVAASTLPPSALIITKLPLTIVNFGLSNALSDDVYTASACVTFVKSEPKTAVNSLYASVALLQLNSEVEFPTS